MKFTNFLLLVTVDDLFVSGSRDGCVGLLGDVFGRMGRESLCHVVSHAVIQAIRDINWLVSFARSLLSGMES